MHTCKALALTCIDFRFRQKINQFLQKHYKNSFDLVSLAGGSKNFQSPKERSILFKQIGVSLKLHHISHLLLFNHQNCGAYGAFLKSGSLQETKEHHQDLREAKKAIKQRFVRLKVRLFFVHFKKSPQKDSLFTEIK